MLALEERSRAVVVINPSILLKPSEHEAPAGPAAMTTGKSLADDICTKFEEEYLEVKARKQVYMTKDKAEKLFEYMNPTLRQATIDCYARGLCEVVVLEHLDDDIVDRAPKFVEKLNEQYTGENQVPAMFCSSSPWECMYCLEFMFPHLDSLPAERTLAIIKSDGIAAGRKKRVTLEEDAEAQAAAAGLLVVAKQNVVVTPEQARIVCEECEDPRGSEGVLTSQPGAIVMLLEGPGAINRWQLICGPPNSGKARDIAPTTLRACWGTDGTSNAVHASTSMASAEKEIKLFFPEGALKLQRTLCIIKPDAMDRLLPLRGDIQAAGFIILKEMEVQLTEERAAEFYAKETDRPYFSAMVKEAISGPCVVMVLCRLEAVSALLQLMGPASVKDAKRLRPTSLRARYGRDGQRNAVHGSESLKNAALEVRFFFPEMGADPVPNDEEVRDFLFRKSSVASMELKNLSEADAMVPGFNPDPTLQQLLSKGLMALCQVQPRGKSQAAVKWLSRWLAENNPNRPSSQPPGGKPFEPPARVATGLNGVSKDVGPPAQEPSKNAPKKQVIDVDVSEEPEDLRGDLADMTPPHVIFVVGGTEADKGAACSKLREEFNFVHVNMADLYREEQASGTYLSTEITKHESMGTLHSDEGLKTTMQLLKKVIMKHQDTNRFLLDGFPVTLKEAKTFEQQIAEVSFIMHFDMSPETMKQRIDEHGGEPIDDKELEEQQTNLAQMLKYYAPIGKVRKVNAEKKAEEVYAEAKRYLCCRFVYLLGPPGAPVDQIAAKMESKYGYSAISLTAALSRYVESGAEDAAKIKQSLTKGKPVDASIACPLVVSEVFRDMALGVQNFVLTDFPQTAKQAQFLEYRVPSFAKPMLLDFSQADAKDLSSASGADLLEMELSTAEFFGAETQSMLQKELPGMVTIPCSLAGVASAPGSGREEKLVNVTWNAVGPKVMPGLTIVLGPPCSGTETLANLLAGLTPNTQAVDCNLLLDRALERRTEAGITMHNMLARGQVVPLSMTLELLKDVVNLTCSDSLVIENCPMYVDQIEYIVEEFRIDRVFYIDGTAKALEEWRNAFIALGKDGGREQEIFDERVERLHPIVSHFARLGKLERIEVNTSPKEAKLAEEVKKATMPQFAIVSGPSAQITSNLAASLAIQTGAGTEITTEFLVNWAKTKLERTVDPNDPKEFFSALKKYADATTSSLLVLDRYPNKAEDAAEFYTMFGEPKVMMYVDVDEDTLFEDWQAATEGQEDLPEEDVKRAELAEMKKTYKGAFDELATRSPSSSLPVVTWDKETSNPDSLVISMREKLRPRSYVIVAPSGRSDFCNSAADKICTSKGDPAAKPAKFTVVNSNDLIKPGRRSAEIEDRLKKAAYAAEAPDCLPIKLWIDLFKDAFAQSTNPMGNFLVTNFPTPCATTPHGPTIRDQFHLLEEASTVMGIFFVKLSNAAFQTLISAEPADWEAYQSIEQKISMHVNKEGKGQFDGHRVCEYVVDSGDDLDSVLGKLADEFQTFKERAEQAPK